MVTFKEDSFVIEIKSPAPVEDWLNLHNDIANLLSSEHEDMRQGHYLVLYFLQEMMPTIKQAIQMAK